MTVRFVDAATLDDPEDAEAFRRRLLDDGIVAGLVPITEPGHRDAGKVRLEVQEEFAADVHRLLAGRPGVVRAGDSGEEDTTGPQLLLPRPGPPWTCPNCRATVEDSRFTCPECRCLRPSQTEPAAAGAGSADLTEEPTPGGGDLSTALPPAPSEPSLRLPFVGSLKHEDRANRELVLAVLAPIGMTGLICLGAGTNFWWLSLPLMVLMMTWSVSAVVKHVSGRSDSARFSGCLGWVLIVPHLGTILWGLAAIMVVLSQFF
jgi:hypothetical protein